MKKIISLLTIFSLILVACGGSDDNGGNKENEKKTIKVAVVETYVEYMEEAAKAFNEETGHTVQVLEVADIFTDVIEKIPTLKGNGPDLFVLPNDRVGNLGSQKLLKDFDIDLSDYSENAQKASEYNGKKYFLPLSTETTLLIRNVDLMPEEPKSIKEMGPENFLAKYTDFYFAAGMFTDNGGYVFGNDTLDLGLNNEGSIKGATNIQELYRSGNETWTLMQDDSVGYDIMMDSFLEGKVASVVNGPWALHDIEKAGINYAVSNVPSYDGQGNYQALTGIKGLGVNAYSKSADASVEFVKFLATKEYAEKWHEATREVSPHSGVTYEAGSVYQVVLDASNNGYVMPTDPEFSYVWDPMKTALQQIAAGEDVKSALDAAVESISNQIKADQ